MPSDGEQQPEKRPDYKVYRARRGFFSRVRKGDLSSLRKPAEEQNGDPKKGTAGPIAAAGGGVSAADSARLRGEPSRHWYDRFRGHGPSQGFARRALRWAGMAAAMWILISFAAFAISAQLQKSKLADDAKGVLGGNPALIASAQTILVIGTDARPAETKEGGAETNQKCIDEGAHGQAPTIDCAGFRADTLLLLRAGGGTFRKLSIPRDSFAEIPGNSAQKINGAYAFGGAALQVKTVENFLGIDVDHVVIVDFEGFQQFIDAIGGVKVDIPHRLCAEISGGAGGGQGGQSLRFKAGENTLDGEDALAYARIRKPSECPGKGTSEFSLGYDDLDRAAAQQRILGGIKGRLTSPLRLPYNFIKGPFIGWAAPKAFVSDMGAFTMPQLVLSSVVASNGDTDVLCGKPASGCGAGPDSSIEVPDSERRRAADKLLNG